MKTKERSATRTQCPMQHTLLSTEQLVGLRIGDQAFEPQSDRLHLKTSHDPSLPHPLQFPIPRQTFLSTIHKKR